MAKKASGRGAADVGREELASIELVGKVRDVLGREVSRFSEADSSWHVAPSAGGYLGCWSCRVPPRRLDDAEVAASLRAARRRRDRGRP